MEPEPDKHERSGGPRIGLIRGVLVIITAVAIGAFVVSQGLEDPQTTSVAAASGEEADGADAETDDADADDGAAVDDEVAGAEAASGGDDAMGDGTDDAMADSDDDAMADSSDDTAMADDDDASTDTSEPAGPAIRDPSEVTVLVLNGAGAKGIAGRGSAILDDAGYDVLAPKNADFLGPSLVLYTEGYEEEAEGVATAFGVEPSAVVGPYDAANSPINDIRGAAIIVVVGEDGLINV